MPDAAPRLLNLADRRRQVRQALSDSEWRGEEDRARALAEELREIDDAIAAGAVWLPTF